MRFQCAFCSFVISDIPASILGRKVQCPNCGKKFVLPVNELEEGRIFGDFVLGKRLGSGSIGSVYMGRQLSLDRTVALKVLSREYTNEKGATAFLREARAAARLSHPNLVQCYAVGEEDGTCYMAMNYIRGTTVKDKMRRDGKIGIDEALHIAQQVAEALHFAWEEAELIHRDVKPDNIMIDEEGVVKLTDLGLAMQQGEWSEDMEISGSPSYMSPEQFAGEKLDTRSDIYSLGISLYQMLLGELPFDGATLTTVARQHFYEKPPQIRKKDPLISAKVANLVRKMIAKHPDDRFQTMDELLENIWELRQKTAPEKELVPGVHTISMKRLDYDLQNMTKRKRQQVKSVQAEEKKKSDALFKTVIVLIPILVAALVFMLALRIRTLQKHKETHAAVDRLFAALEAPEQYDEFRVSDQYESLKAQFSVGDGEFDRHIRNRLELYSALRRNRNLEAEIENLRSSHQRDTAPKSEVQKSIEYVRKIRELEAEVNKLENRIVVMEKLTHDTLEKNKEIQKELGEQKAAREKLQSGMQMDGRSEISVKVYSFIRQKKLDEAEKYLEILLLDYSGEDAAWIEKQRRRVSRIKKMYTRLTDAAVDLIDRDIYEGIIVHAEYGGRFTVRDVSGQVEDYEWGELSLDSILTLTSESLSGATIEDLVLDAALLVGEVEEAVERMPGDYDSKVYFKGFCDATIENMRVLAAGDRKIAIEKARILLKRFEGGQACYGLREKLKKILNR